MLSSLYALQGYPYRLKVCVIRISTSPLFTNFSMKDVHRVKFPADIGVMCTTREASLRFLPEFGNVSISQHYEIYTKYIKNVDIFPFNYRC